MDFFEKRINDKEKIKNMLMDLKKENITAIDIHNYNMNVDNELLLSVIKRFKDYELIGHYLRKINKKEDLISSINYYKQELENVRKRQQWITEEIKLLKEKITNKVTELENLY